MGFALSILYLVTSYLSPATLFGPLAAAHIELILGVLILSVSLPAMIRSFALKTPQSLALIGLAFAVILSVLIGMRWAGGGVQAFLVFMPNALAYFFVCLHCDSKKKLKALILMLLFVCFFVIARGGIDLLHGVSEDDPAISASTGSVDQDLWNSEHPYVFEMHSDSGDRIYRLRGLGLINDPNDFGQLIVCVIPLMFIFWRAKKIPQNLAFVIFPVSALLFGLILTHSRGALVALMAVAVVAARRRIGTLPALMLAGVLFAAAMALHFTGGRDISATAGEDRTALWGESLQLFKSHPLFGVGFGQLPEYLGHTSHNTVAVCAAELGLFGLFFWSMFMFATVKDALVVASPGNVSEGEPVVAEAELFPQAARTIETIDKAEINNLGRLVVLSLTGFLVGGLFLSRAFVLTLFLLGGMAEVVYEMALQRGMVAPRMPLRRLLPYSGGLAVLLVLGLYIMLRILNLMH
jgi:hypothetical protein